MGESSLAGVEILEEPKGLPDDGIVIKSVFNTNGYGIDTIQSTVGTAFTCALITPNGFSKITIRVTMKFLLGIEKHGTTGTGHNSEDYGYEFFKVVSVIDTDPYTVKFDIVGLTTNTGIAVTVSQGLKD